jgi:hypothetical protein
MATGIGDAQECGQEMETGIKDENIKNARLSRADIMCRLRKNCGIQRW